MFDPVIIKHEQIFKPSHAYYADGYTLRFDGYWKLTYQKSDKVPEVLVMTDGHKSFIDIVRMLDLKPFKTSDTIGEDSIFQNESCENVSSWKEAFPDNEMIANEEAEAYGEIDKSFSIYETVNNL